MNPKEKRTQKNLFDTIPVPSVVSERMATIARNYVPARLQGETIEAICKANGVGKNTWYEWLDIPEFQAYIDQLQDVAIPADEMEVYQKLKKKILAIGLKSEPTLKEIELFTDHFEYLVEADKRQRMEALGLNETHKPTSHKTLEERKAGLLSRLKS